MRVAHESRIVRRHSLLPVRPATILVCAAFFAQFLQAGAALGKATSSLLLDDFEAEPKSWEYVGGWEFPGAKGSLEWDKTIAHKGKGSLKLEADFSNGGAYVGLWKKFDAFKSEDVKEIRLWIRSAGVERIGVRIVDDTDQCHQKKGIALAKTDKWQEVVLRLDNLVGDESWGGASDRKWHGPAKAFGINIGTDSLSSSWVMVMDKRVRPG